MNSTQTADKPEVTRLIDEELAYAEFVDAYRAYFAHGTQATARVVDDLYGKWRRVLGRVAYHFKLTALAIIRQERAIDPWDGVLRNTAWPHADKDGHAHAFAAGGCFCIHCGKRNDAPDHLSACRDRDWHAAPGSFDGETQL